MNAHDVRLKEAIYKNGKYHNVFVCGLINGK